MSLGSSVTQFWKKRRRGAYDHWRAYLFFAALRIVLVFIPQLGYVHPDEFFQTLEIMNGDQFQLEHIRSWEFSSTMPLRSITLPFALLRIPMTMVHVFGMFLKEAWGVDILCSYTYLVVPRLIYCAASFVNDWCLYQVCRLYSLRSEIRLLALSSSWVMLVYGARTFSNTLEMTLCSLLLYLVADCMITTNTVVYKREFLEERYDKASSVSERVKIWKIKNSLPEHNFNKTLAMSSLCVAGVFNRPTFLLFGAPMVFYWLLRGMGTKTVTFKDFHLRMLFFCLAAIPALVVFSCCDSMYYNYLTLGEMQMSNVGINNFVFTPWNFIKYNLDSNKTAEHGLHPKYIHLLVNIPLLFGIMGIIAMVSFAQMMIRFFRAEYQGLPRAQSLIGLMSGSIFIPLFFLSLINHQEPRFLIPLLLPLVLLHGPKLVTGFSAQYPFKVEHSWLRIFYDKFLCTRASAMYVLKLWYIANIALTVFFGFVHQAGVFPLAQHFEQSMKLKAPDQTMHLITSHTYMFPLSFVNLPNANLLHFDPQTRRRYKKPKDFFLYEYGSLDMDQLMAKIKLIISHCEMKKETRKVGYRVFLAVPTSLSDELHLAFVRSNATFLQYELRRSFYPHLSTEAPPQIYGRHPGVVDPPHWSRDDLKGTCAMEQEPQLSYSYISRQFSSLIHQFGLALYEFEVKRSSAARSRKEAIDGKCYN